MWPWTIGSSATFSSWRCAVASRSRAQTFTGTRPWVSSRAMVMVYLVGRFEIGKHARSWLLHAQLVDLALRSLGVLEEIVGAGERHEAESGGPQVAERRALPDQLLRLGLADVLQQRPGRHQCD